MNKKLLIYISLFVLIGSFVVYNIISINKEHDINKNIIPSNIYKASTIVEVDKKHNRGLILLNQGKFEEAIYYWENIIDTEDIGDIKILDEYKILLANSYLGYGNSFYKEEEYSQKAFETLESTSDCSNNEYCLYFKGYSYEITRNYDLALELYNEALEISKQNENSGDYILNQIGHLYALKGEKEIAYDYYKKAYDINPSPYTAGNIGRSLAVDYKIQEAIPYFEKALTEIDDEFLKAEINYNLSSMYIYLTGDTLDNYQKAINYGQEAINLNSKYPLGYVGVARVLIIMGEDLDTAEKLLKDSIELYPNSSISYEQLGLLEQERENYDKSIDYFNKSESLLEKDIILMQNDIDPNKSKLNFLKAISYSKKGKSDIAMEKLEKSLENPHYFVLMMLNKQANGEDNIGDELFANLKGKEEFEDILEKISDNSFLK